MCEEYFAENYKAIGTLFRELQASEQSALKRISKRVFNLVYTTSRATIVALGLKGLILKI